MAADDPIDQLQEKAFLAGRYHQAIQDDPRLAGGLGRLRDKLAGEVNQIARQLRAKSLQGRG
ncbi:hypothetical protein LRS10_09555 [Phenylobacterium sp. J426]|uniref:hypothetical protein n=1 Tax=Phenylobacterium sp. J426 TaxID=2898439 RepID=UPI002151A0F0|nr:hypothetical protein [Phenylobacterium sp. J426]MCR5874388.1 hypothetical protein [Phenylobacterium sp. J426]